MRIEPLCRGEADRRRGERGEARSIAADDRAALHEIEDAEAGGETRAARRRQYVVRPGDVIADRLGGVAAEENRAGVVHPGGESVGLLDRQFEMLGSDPVDQ